MEDEPLDRAALENASLAGVELVEPRGEQGLDRRRHRDLAAVFRGHGDHLLDEEWIASGRLEDPVAQSVRDPVGECPDQLARGFRAERLEQHVRRVQLAATPSGSPVEQLGPCHAEQEDRRAAAEIRDVLHEVEKGRLAPVDVVEDHDERPIRGARLQELAEAPGDLLRRARRRLVAQDRRKRLALGLSRPELLHDLCHGPVADPLAVGEAPAGHDGGALEGPEELVREPRLPDSGRPEDREEVA